MECLARDPESVAAKAVARHLVKIASYLTRLDFRGRFQQAAP